MLLLERWKVWFHWNKLIYCLKVLKARRSGFMAYIQWGCIAFVGHRSKSFPASFQLLEAACIPHFMDTLYLKGHTIFTYPPNFGVHFSPPVSSLIILPSCLFLGTPVIILGPPRISRILPHLKGLQSLSTTLGPPVLKNKLWTYLRACVPLGTTMPSPEVISLGTPSFPNCSVRVPKHGKNWIPCPSFLMNVACLSRFERLLLWEW